MSDLFQKYKSTTRGDIIVFDDSTEERVVLFNEVITLESGEELCVLLFNQATKTVSSRDNDLKSFSLVGTYTLAPIRRI